MKKSIYAAFALVLILSFGCSKSTTSTRDEAASPPPPPRPPAEAEDCKLTRNCQDALRNLTLSQIETLQNSLRTKLNSFERDMSAEMKRFYASFVLGFELERVLQPNFDFNDETFLKLLNGLVSQDGELIDASPSEILRAL